MNMRQCDKCQSQQEVHYQVCNYDLCYSCYKKSKPISDGAEKKSIDEWMKEESSTKKIMRKLGVAGVQKIPPRPS